MPPTDDTHDPHDPFNLHRFVSAQEPVYAAVRAELRRGQKRTHWMWFIFPQLNGLGSSPTSKYYAIKSSDEARSYLGHPILGRRLVDCAEMVLDIRGRSAADIFGAPDDLKLRSSMTLFAAFTDAESVFARVLDTYFQGQRDRRTLELLTKHNASDTTP